MRAKRSNSFSLKAESQYAPIVSRAVGVVDFFFAAAAAYFVLELVIRFSSFNRMYSEIGLLPLVACVLLFLSFAWAGISLFRRPNAWKIQIVPIASMFAMVVLLGVQMALAGSA